MSLGCVGGSNETTAEDKERLKAYILDTAPAVAEQARHRLRRQGHAARLRGRARRGRCARAVASSSRCTGAPNKKLDDGWNLFTHVLDGSGERILNIDNVGPLREWRDSRQALWPSAGSPARSTSTSRSSRFPTTIKTDKVQIVVGIWRDDDRLKIQSGPHDPREPRHRRQHLERRPARRRSSRRRARACRSLRVDKLEKGTKINDRRQARRGGLEDRAASPDRFVDVRTGQPNTSFPVNGSVKLLWSDDGIYLGFDVKDPDVDRRLQERRQGPAPLDQGHRRNHGRPRRRRRQQGLLRDPDQPAEPGVRLAVRRLQQAEDRSRRARSATRNGQRS